MKFSAVLLRSVMLAALVGIATACGDDDDGNGPSAPATPTGLTAQAQDDGSILVTWQAVTDATSYRLERAEQGQSGAFTQVGGTLTSTSYTDTDVEPGVGYTYRVAAVNAIGTSPFTDPEDVTPGEGPSVATLTGNITASRTLFADTVYTLAGVVKVTNGSTLTIEPGTRILGDAATPGSSLWILRGAQIDAQGTAQAPIVFTSSKAAGARAPGDWGGIVIVGNGIINRTGVVATEGPANVAENYAGGTDNASSSGTRWYPMRWLWLPTRCTTWATRRCATAAPSAVTWHTPTPRPSCRRPWWRSAASCSSPARAASVRWHPTRST